MYKLLKIKALLLITLFLAIPGAVAQKQMVNILVCIPDIEHQAYRPIADVMAGSIIRELKRSGGMEIAEIGSDLRYLKANGQGGRVNSRERALEVGEALETDIVIFSTVRNSYDSFLYTVAFLEIERDVLQRTLKGTFRISASPAEIGRKMKDETEKLVQYIPLPSELADFGSIIRQITVDPESLPETVEIEGIPRIGLYGRIEQILSYYRAFPGEDEYQKLEKTELITRFKTREDMDEDLSTLLNQFYIYGDFALRHNLQAFLIKDCSPRAINVLLANRIPVFIGEDLLIGYEGLSPDGFCMYKTIEERYQETFDLTHRKRVAVLFIVPKPGRKLGVSRDYLENAVGYYRDELGKTPELVEIKDSMFDIIASGLD